jgi:hypothetical protein
MMGDPPTNMATPLRFGSARFVQSPRARAR